MKLYHAPASPFVRKIMVLLHEGGKTGEVSLVGASGTPLDPGTMPIDRNPLGKLPVLELDDGEALYDSRVICRYLDDRFALGFYPKPPALWQALTLEATADGIADAAVLMRYETAVRPVDLQSAAWIDGQWAKIERSLDAIQVRWIAHLDLRVDMAQIALACALSYLDFRHAERDWRGKRTDLARFHADFSERQSMKSTGPGA